MDIKNIELDKLPSINLENRRELPEVSGIYFAIDSKDNIQYIGRSVNINQRWKYHHRTQQLSSLSGVRIVYLEVCEISLLDGIEQALIDYYNPYLNNTFVVNKSDKVNGKVQAVIYLTSEEKEQVKQLALEEQTSSSYYIARLIREHLSCDAGAAK